MREPGKGYGRWGGGYLFAVVSQLVPCLFWLPSSYWRVLAGRLPSITVSFLDTSQLSPCPFWTPSSYCRVLSGHLPAIAVSFLDTSQLSPCPFWSPPAIAVSFLDEASAALTVERKLTTVTRGPQGEPETHPQQNDQPIERSLEFSNEENGKRADTATFPVTKPPVWRKIMKYKWRTWGPGGGGGGGQG